MNSFTEDLSIALTLIQNDETTEIKPGQVSQLELNLQSYGFSGSVRFVVSLAHGVDEPYIVFCKDDVLECTLEIKSRVIRADETALPLVLHGMVTHRNIRDYVLESSRPDKPLIYLREYNMQFSDVAAVLWHQHYPCELYLDTSFNKVLTEHAGEQITLNSDWDELDKSLPMLVIALGISGNMASFYDFVMALVDTRNGVFFHDYSNNSYNLAASKPSEGNSTPIKPELVSVSTRIYPSQNRAQPRILNGSVTTPETTAIENSLGVSPIRKDYLIRKPIKADHDERVQLETSRLVVRQVECVLNLNTIPAVMFKPGDWLEWENTDYRIKEWRFSAESVSDDPNNDHNMDYAYYHMNSSLVLEHAEESSVSLPDYIIPAYPMQVEGFVVSDEGEDKDLTYQFEQDSDTSLDFYQVSLPLWEDKKIKVPFEPGFLTGQFYFPLYKKARVLVDLYMLEARIAELLDWRDGARLAMDTQGNQILMGKSDKSLTAIRHAYKDQKPELELQRIDDKDTEVLRMSEGSI
ncbi:MAG: hypothetical protein ACR2HF_08040, partial [Methylococcaceae bacterium]